MIDKEFLRLWFAERYVYLSFISVWAIRLTSSVLFVNRCDPYKDETIPAAPDELVVELSQRYIKLYEMITGETFEVPPVDVDVKRRIDENVGKALGK